MITTSRLSCIAFFVMFGSDITCAQPNINTVSGTLSHKATITITGSRFGKKSSAAPLMWDDGEDRVVNDQSSVLDKGWVDPWPRSYTGSNQDALDATIQYRSIPYRNTPAPHTYSTKYLAGGHYQFPGNSPPYIGSGAEDYKNVTVTADGGSSRPRWFAMFYYRLDPLWRSVRPPYNNHKVTTVQSGGKAYTPGGGFNYIVYHSGRAPAATSTPVFNYQGFNSRQTFSLSEKPVTNSPRLQWIHYEERISDDDVLGFRDLFIDNQVGLELKRNCPNWFNGQGGKKASGIRSFSIGGYYRWGSDIDDISTYQGDANHFRYFDDVYIDNTLSRVMLADNQDYDSASIIEPQIPSAWNDASISVTVNLARLRSVSKVYLFVFDADNNHNPVGLCVIGGDQKR